MLVAGVLLVHEEKKKMSCCFSLQNELRERERVRPLREQDLRQLVKSASPKFKKFCDSSSTQDVCRHSSPASDHYEVVLIGEMT